jgi:ubiquitin-protein ligase
MASAKRLQKELKDLTVKNHLVSQSEIIVADDFLILQSDTIHKWSAILFGPSGTPYEGGRFLLEINIPTDYPFKPPKMKFITKIFHPNIDNLGRICHQLFADNWSPALTIEKLIKTILSMMLDPKPDITLKSNDILMPEIAKLYRENLYRFNEIAREWTSKYARELSDLLD